MADNLPQKSYAQAVSQNSKLTNTNQSYVFDCENPKYQNWANPSMFAYHQLFKEGDCEHFFVFGKKLEHRNLNSTHETVCAFCLKSHFDEGMRLHRLSSSVIKPTTSAVSKSESMVLDRITHVHCWLLIGTTNENHIYECGSCMTNYHHTYGVVRCPCKMKVIIPRK
jgi:hypothetical protein